MPGVSREAGEMIFEVTPEQVAALSDANLRTLVGYLAEQEVRSQGYSAAAVTYGGHQNARDGGIDVKVDLDTVTMKGYVPRAKTGFQVKTEDMPRAAILKEMAPKSKLRDAIRGLGEAKGAYIIVSSKGSLSNTALTERRNAMAATIANEPSAAALYLDFYDRRRIATWVNQHPGLIPWVRSRSGNPLSGWQAFGDWSSSPGAIDEEYILDNGTRLIGAKANDQSGLRGAEGLNQLRKILHEPKGAVRLVGLSGVGKTRLVQALFDERIGEAPLDRGLVVYTDLADEPDPVPQELLSRLQQFNHCCILVIDNCGMELHRKLATRIKEGGAPISLVTIEYDISDEAPEGTDVYRLEPATREVIEKIVQRKYPALTLPEVNSIAEFSEGNSRIALALAETSKDGTSLANLKDTELFTRLFRQKNDPDPTLLEAAKVLSLVYSFDGETLEGEKAELPILAALAEQTVTALHGRVAELQRRMLVQKRSIWRALLPHALAHRLAKQALQDIPRDIIRTKFINVAPERLLKSFSRRLGCLHDSQEAQEIVHGWVTDDNWLSKIENLNELGLVLLDNVAPVNPEATLDAIEKAVARTPEILSDTHRHHSPIVRLLRSLAYDPALFDRAVRLISVAASSKESSNNTADAINIYKSLFFLWLSGTHATVEQRTTFVKRIAQELPDSPHLVTSALDALLECHWFSSHYGFEFGARKRDYGSNPRLRSETLAWYCAVFKLCAEIGKFPHLRGPVRMMLANQFRGLATHMYRVEELISLAEGFAADGGWPEGWAGARGAARELREMRRSADAALMEQLAAKLEPRSLEQRITTYVLPEPWSRLDLADIEGIEDDKKYQKANAQIEQICSEIGVELAEDLVALQEQLPIMLAGQTSRAFTVISSVAKHAQDVEAAWNVILDDAAASAAAGRAVNSPAFFVAGLKERDEEAVERLLDAALDDDCLRPIFVTMQINAGVNARGCKRLVQAVSIPEIPTLSFMGLMYGGACSKLSGEEFKRMILAIAGRDDGVTVAAEIMHMRIFGLRSDKREVSDADQEAGRELLRRMRFSSSMHKLTHELAGIAEACMTPHRDDELARQICTQLRESANSWGIMASDFGDLIGVLGRKFPLAVLDVLVEQPGPKSGRSLFRSFRENRPCPLRVIDDEVLLRWAHAKPETRFILLAGTVGAWGPSTTVEDEEEETVPAGGRLEWTLAIRRLFREAPDPVAVLEALRARLHPSSWSGSLADKLSSRLPLLEALTQETDQRISAWAAAELPKFVEEIEKARILEAEIDRERDEKFEW
jgi:hypothetical protein